MDPIIQHFITHGVIPALAVAALALAALYFPRTIPAIFTTAAYMCGYWLLFKPTPPVATWHSLVPAGVIAGIAAVVIEVLPNKFQWRLPAYLAAALLCAYYAAPRPAAGNPHLAAYISLIALTSAAWLVALRLPARKYIVWMPMVVLCITALAFGFLLADAGPMIQGEMAMLVAVPLGAMAFFSILPGLRDLTSASLTPAALILPGLGAMAFYYCQPDSPGAPPIVANSVFVLTAIAPLTALIALLPIVRRTWLLGAIAPVVLTGGLMGTAVAIKKPAAPSSAVPAQEQEILLPGASEPVKKTPYKQPPPGSSIE